MAIIELGCSFYLTIFREHFWNAISNREQLQFIQQLGIFTIVAVVIGFVSGLSGYLVSLTAIKWRQILNANAINLRNSKIENVSQRIQEDCSTYPDLVLNLGWSFLKAIIYIVVFSAALIYSFSYTYLLIILAYTIIGSLITHYIAKPLIHLNYENQRVEASYRQVLTDFNFRRCVDVMLGLAKKQKHLTYFQQFYGQVGVVIPLIIIAPIFFTTGMTLGSLMRFNSIGNTIIDNMNTGVNSFGMINRLISCRKRLKEAAII